MASLWTQGRASRLFGAVLTLLLACVPAPSRSADAPGTIYAWLYPGLGTAALPAGGWDAVTARSVPGSSRSFTEAEVRSRSQVIDWFPDSHDPLPGFMANSEDQKIYACAKCHMPNGNGRLENAPVSGLPAQYILDQVSAIVEGSRHLPPDISPPNRMVESAAHLTASQLAKAAAYFSKLPFTKRVKLRETDMVPQTEAFGGILRIKDGPPEALGERIIEIPEDFERFELRDPNLDTLAFVPKGSVAAGKRRAMTGGGDLSKACASCHGNGLKGQAGLPGPPIAGRFPTYLLRQLYGFQTHLRDEPLAGVMGQVVEGMSLADMVDLAAYAASLDP